MCMTNTCEHDLPGVFPVPNQYNWEVDNASAVDALFQMLMKDAAKCTVQSDLQISVKPLGVEYCACL